MIHANKVDRVWRIPVALALWLIASAGSAFADGMVVPQVYYPKVEIPDQQALIGYADGIERLVIETSFQGDGTNFAWVVPVPSVPEIKPVPEGFFEDVRTMFRPRLVHQVHPYWIGILFVCGVAFLAWRSYKDEVGAVVDVPFCLALSVGAGLAGGSAVIALLALVLAVCSRVFARTTAVFAMVTLMAVAFSAALVFPPGPNGWGYFVTMGEIPTASVADGVRVISVQRAGVFDATTIRGSNPRGVIEWLERNGYDPAKSAEGAIGDYVSRGWVFVASKVRRDAGKPGRTALHPLAFTFLAKTAVYPMRLTAMDKDACLVDLFVFGNQCAAAHYFHAERCDRVAMNWEPHEKNLGTWLRVPSGEVLNLIGASTVGTELSASLTPKQMETDAEIKWSGFRTKRAYVYSDSGAATIALNVALPFAVLGWLSLGASRGAWKVDSRQIWRWRWRVAAAAIVIGTMIFFLLPKVDIVAG